MRAPVRHPPAMVLVDSGATHTRALVASEAGAKLGESRTGPSNAFAAGIEISLANVKRAVHKALAAARMSRQHMRIAVIGSASVDYRGKGSAPLDAALRAYFGRARVLVVGDALIALEGALAGESGIVVLSGTGSVVLGRSSRGKMVQVGGWGPLLGDQGSAQWVAREALRAAARAVDGTGPRTSLVRAIEQAFRINSWERIIDIVYQHPMSPAELGALAPLVSRAAQRGDACACRIFQRAGEELAAQAAAAITRMRLKQPVVAYQGSMFLAGKLLLDPLLRSLRRRVPGARLQPPVLPPLGGAFLIALRELGLEAKPSTLAKFRENCYG